MSTMAERFVIRTPDQRIRVFVSSTLRELEPRAPRRPSGRSSDCAWRPSCSNSERARIRRASCIAPTSQQSDVFVGIYGASYGWIAPGRRRLGARGRVQPRPGGDAEAHLPQGDCGARAERLTELIDRIKADDTVSYVSFSTPEELAERVAADLATLLAERFDGARPATPDPASAPGRRVPAPYTEAIGREADVIALVELLEQEAVRLVTLVGPGGIGKSRLAIEVAQRIAAGEDPRRAASSFSSTSSTRRGSSRRSPTSSGCATPGGAIPWPTSHGRREIGGC